MDFRSRPEDSSCQRPSPTAADAHGSSVEADIRHFYDQEGWALDKDDALVDTRRWGATFPSRIAHGQRVLSDINALFEGGGAFFLNCGCRPFTDTAMVLAAGYSNKVCIDISARALGYAVVNWAAKGHISVAP